MNWLTNDQREIRIADMGDEAASAAAHIARQQPKKGKRK